MEYYITSLKNYNKILAKSRPSQRALIAVRSAAAYFPELTIQTLLTIINYERLNNDKIFYVK